MEHRERDSFKDVLLYKKRVKEIYRGSEGDNKSWYNKEAEFLPPKHADMSKKTFAVGYEGLQSAHGGGVHIIRVFFTFVWSKH